MNFLRAVNKDQEPSQVEMSNVIRLALGIFLSLCSALLLTLSMPPYGIWPLAVIGFLPMILAQYRILPDKISSLASALTIGGLVGFYIMDAFLNLPGAPWYMRFLPILFGVFVLVTDSRTRAFHEKTEYRWFVINGSICWVGVEMIRSLIPVLGTWGFIAYSYFKQAWLIQPSSIFGIFGLSLVNMVLSYTLGLGLLRWFDKRWWLDPDVTRIDDLRAKHWLIGTGFLVLSWVGLSLLQIQPQMAPNLRVAAVQTGFKSLWTETEIAENYLSHERYEEIYAQHYQILLEQTRDIQGTNAEIIVWPEGAVNFDPQIDHTIELKDLAAELNAFLVIPYGVDYRNEVTVLAPDGTFLGVYGKNHPVLFVNEKSDTHGIYPTYQTSLGEIGTIICYDLDFTDTARKVAKSGADLIAVPSGDWPGIADKHYAHLVFRAVENRVAMIKADRSYDSAIIDPYGRILSIVSKTDANNATLVADVDLVDNDTIQQNLGDWIGWMSLGGLVFFAILTPIIMSKKK